MPTTLMFEQGPYIVSIGVNRQRLGNNYGQDQRFASVLRPSPRIIKIRLLLLDYKTNAYSLRTTSQITPTS